MGSVPHLILVGLPGAGKSTVGQAVAARLGVRFIDLDAEIERKEGRSVADIFAEHGEGYFRERERSVSADLASLAEPAVVATGGGWVTNPDVVALLRPPGRIIYLQVSPERAMARLGAAQSARPLLAGPDPLGAMRMLMKARAELYEHAADAVIDTDLLTSQQVTDKVNELVSAPRGR